MKKKHLAALLVSDVPLPSFSTIVISALLASSAVETAHRFTRYTLPQDDAHEEPYNRTPIERGRANAYATSTATVAPNVSGISPWIR